MSRSPRWSPSIRLGALALLLGALSPSVGQAEGEGEELACPIHRPVSATRLLRRTSLALVGRVPTIDEYEAVEGLDPEGAELDEVVEAMLDSDEYRLQMRRYHLQLLWTNPDGAPLRDAQITVAPVNLPATAEHGQVEQVWRVTGTGRRRNYRRKPNGTPSTAPRDCYNVPHVTLQAGYVAGDPVAPGACIEVDHGDEVVCHEGWTELSPFVDPSQTIRVCARDAQTTESYAAQQYTCYGNHATNRQECGCGPEMRHCMFAGAFNQDRVVTQAMQEQMLRIVDDFTSGAEPYVGMLTDKRTYINGTLSFYLRHQAPVSNYNRVINEVFAEKAEGLLPADTPYLDQGWVRVERGGLHAGILTTPAYLLRFQTDRGRANRARIAFLGQYFVPGAGSQEGCTTDGEDLTQRCYCRDCHQTLEPMAAYFGAFVEAGSSMIGLDVLPAEVATQQACNALHFPAQGAFCNRFYRPVTLEDDSVVFRRNPLEMVDLHPEYQTHFEGGPAALVTSEMLAPLAGKDYSYLSWSTVQGLYRFLVGRDIDLDPLSPNNEQAVLDELATSFESGFDFRALVKRIVSLPTFRRMP